MRSPQSVKALEQLGRVRLSDSFFMRDLLLIRLLSTTTRQVTGKH